MKIYPAKTETTYSDLNQNINIQTPKHKREKIIDILRGFAVIAMIITHVIAITYSGNASSKAVYYIGLFGGIFSFTSFLFISGMAAYYSTFSPEVEEHGSRNARVVRKTGRLIKLLFAYYILATASILVNTSLYSFPPSFSWLNNIISTLFFFIVPVFSEFLIPLFLISLTVLLLPKLYKYLIKNPLFGLFFMSVIYGIGSLISQIDFGSDKLNTLKALLGGQVYSDGALHAFPLFQYFPIFLLGIYLGHFFYNHRSLIHRIRVNIIWLIVFIGLTVTGTLSYLYLRSTLLFPLPDQGRFPPSITFLTLSLSLTLIVLLLFQIFYKVTPKFIKNIFNYFGITAIEALVFSTLLLFGYKYFTTTPENPDGIKHLYFTDILILTFIVLFFSAVFTSIKNYLKKWTLKEKDYNTVWWFFTERSLVSLVFIIIFTVVGASLYQEVFIKPALADTNTVIYRKRLILQEENWWDDSFGIKRLITVKNTSSSLPLFSGSWITLKFDHEKAIGEGTAAMKDGTDLRIIYFDSDKGSYLVLPFLLEKPNTSSTAISFKLIDNLDPGNITTNYFLYYGNEFAEKFSVSKDKYTSTPTSDGISLGDEQIHPVKLSLNRKWFLKNQISTAASTNLIIDANTKGAGITDNSVVTYAIDGTNKSGKLTLKGNSVYEASINLTGLDTGTYSIQVNATDSNNILKINRSQKLSFIYTYPLYVTWTFDWEGWDVSQDNLNAIANIEDTYGIQSTHFFNPRIYVKKQSDQNGTIATISKERADYLTNWIKDRQQNHGDEIGMHIHMWDDMVKEAGVTPRTSPIIQGTYGSDVPSYAYTESELEKIYTWGRNKLIDKGLGSPISFRIGAWMGGENVLTALQNTGFLIDSSGRTGGLVNANVSYSTKLPWNLKDTTYPYLPSKSDINKWEGNLSDRLSIWEFPDNGADSYWFTKEDLIKRFNDNFTNKQAPLDHPQDLVYLTHPHWFVSVDEWKIKALFDDIKQYRYSDDKGPVVFANLETVFSQWDTTKFINGD